VSRNRKFAIGKLLRLEMVPLAIIAIPVVGDIWRGVYEPANTTGFAGFRGGRVFGRLSGGG